MLAKLLNNHTKIIAECAIAERLRRLPNITLHPTLYNAPLIYDQSDAYQAMTEIYQEYLQAASKANLPMLMTAPTWRVDPQRIAQANPQVPKSINTDAVNFISKIKTQQTSNTTPPILIGGLIGPQNDCYKPKLAPTALKAQHFHTTQIKELATTQADFILALTLPSTQEALGIARAISQTNKNYIISFCVGTNGNILDGSTLTKAFDIIDNDPSVKNPPTAYFINCSHPSFITKNYPPQSLERLKGIQANGSSLDVTNLDGSSSTKADPLKSWSADMAELHHTHNVPILGGCCGTSIPHFQALIDILKS